MNPRQWFRVSGSFASAILFAGASLLLVATFPVQAQSAFTAPTTAILATSATQTVTVSITTAGTLATINVLTQGATGQDYAAVAGGTCATSTPYTVGQTCTVKFSFTPTHPWVRYGGISLSDASGKLLGNSFLNGVGTGPQVSYPLSAATVPSVLGSGLSSPLGVAVDGSGNVYVADTGHNAVKELMAVAGVVPASPTIVTWSGFSSPSGVAVDGSGNVYVADTGNNQVKELIAVGGVVPTTPTIVPLGSGYSSPTGVAVDGSGNVYVADMNHNAVDELVAVGGIIHSGATPTPLGSGFSTPEGVAVDGSGDVFVADTHNSLVKEIVAVGGVIPASPTITPLGSGYFQPSGVAVDGSGNVYVADTGNNAVEEIVAVGGVVPSSPTIVTLGTGFTAPGGVAVDASGNVYVADKGNNAAKELSAQIPPTLAFASIAVGLTSSDSPKSVTIVNDGNASLTFPAAATASSANFTPGSGGSPCASGGAGASCTYSVNFTPTVVGTPLTGTLQVTDNAAGSPQTIANLSGTSVKGTLTVTASSTPSQVPLNTTAVTLTASIQYGGIAPAGAVTFTVGGNAVSGTVSCSPVTSTPLICTLTYNPSALVVVSSPYAIVATVAADPNYNTATSTNGATLTITPITPTVNVTPTTAANLNAPITFTATLTNPAGTGFSPNQTASGDTVTFQQNNVTLCSATVNQTTQKATCTTTPSSLASTLLNAGSDTVVATFAPMSDPNYLTAQSQVTQFVNAVTPTVTISPTTAATVNGSVTFTAVLTGNGFSPITTASGDTVTFTANGNPLCAASPLSPTTHTATCTTSSLVGGTDSIGATFNPVSDPNFLTSQAAAVNQTMNPAAVTVGISSWPSSPTPVVDSSASFTATLTTPGGFTVPTASGDTVVFTLTSTSGTTVLCAGAPVSQSTHTATCPTTALVAGSSDTVTATFSPGDPSYFHSGASPTVSGSVSKATPVTTVTSVAPTSSGSSIAVGVPLTLTATVLPAVSQTLLPQTGTLNFYDSAVSATTPVCSVTIVAGVVPSCMTYSFSTSGSHTITASYSNVSGTSTDPNFNSSGLSAGYTPGSVGTAATTVTITSPTTTALIYVDQKITLTATVTPSASNLTGNITFSSNGTTICGPVTISNFTATCTGTLPAQGSAIITALFTDTDGNFGNSTTTQPVSVLSTAVTLTPTVPTNVSLNTPATFTATLTLPSSVITTPASPNAPKGTVTFTPDSNGTTPTSPCAPTVTLVMGSWQASCAVTFSTAGTHTVTVSYANDTNFTAVSNITETVNYGLATPTVTFTSPSTTGSATSVATQTVTFTATVTWPNGGVSPTKTVNFTVPQGTITSTNPCTLSPTTTAGQASCSITATFLPIASGAESVTATYSGDGNYTSASAPFAETVQNFTAAVTSLSFTQETVVANTTVADPFNPVTATYTITPSTFPDQTAITGCSATTQGTTPKTIPGLTCAVTNGVATVSATPAVPVGNYALTLMIGDSKNTGLVQTATGALTILSQAAPVAVGSLGTASASFTDLASVAPSTLLCSQHFATLSGSSYTLSTSTLSQIGIACSNFASNGTSYSFTITAGTQIARLETGHGGMVVAAFLGAPFLLMLGFLPASRKLRKTLLHGLAILALGAILMSATGCGSGGFPEPPGTHAEDGSYLLDIVNGTGATVAEVPVVVSN